jgi:hypothetical protein
MWPTVPGTTAGAVGAGGVAAVAAAEAFWLGAPAGDWAAAGVSPAAAKAIAHPINLIDIP